MSDILNPAQNISYTNKDFQTIFPELLDLAKKLTSRWDPSISNESDPGVVLLKLNAIVADKLNYNIDKNVLECFPLSVTQEDNARKLFEQLGYKMHWYKSGFTNISLKWIGNVGTEYVNIPPFTMVSDADNTVIYSLIGSPNGINDTDFAVTTEKLEYSGEILSIKAIQGIAIKYDINGNTVIKPNHLDGNNRLYFNSNDIAQNGIFITNVGANNYSSWIQKDNLVTENLNNTYYSFGISEDGSVCYIEFPDDAENIIKDGIEITYIKSQGQDGNVSSGIIEKFYNDVYLTDSIGNQVVLTEDNVRILNYSSVTNGQNPESINSAYNNYKRVVGTFDVLVTLRDYINYILRSGLVSNCFVCDRGNDVQCVYSIMTYDNDLDSIKTVQETKFVERNVKFANGTTSLELVEEESLNAFEIKLYLLQSVQDMSNAYNFNQTFNMLSNPQQDIVKYYLEDQKCISHDYADIEPLTTESAHICFFKNKYPVNCKIITKYQLTNSQAAEVAENIRNAFLTNLNASQIDFAEAITLERINDLIVNSDERIKSAIIDNIEYTTYAVYWDGNEFVEVDISSDDVNPITVKIEYAVAEYNPLSGYALDDFCTYNGQRYKCTTAINAPAGRWNVNKWTADDLIISQDYQTFVGKVGFNNYNSFIFTYDGTDWELNSSVVDISEYGFEITGTPQLGDKFISHVSVANQIKGEVMTKSILAGVTPFYKNDELFDYSFNHMYTNVYNEVERISSNVTITLNQTNPSYTLKENEYIQFYAPNFINGTSYSNFVKFEYNINTDVSANSDYQLKSGEYIIFYWKTDDNVIDVYNYYVYGQGNVIKPTFALPKNTSGIIGSSLADSSNLRNIGTYNNPIYVADYSYNGPMSSTISDGISAIVSKDKILSGMKTITIRRINSIELDSSYYCYWILNDEIDGNYVLFNEDPDAESQTYLLNTGEYFFYTNGTLTELGILGSGTSITRNSGEGKWVVPATVDIKDIFENGTSALVDVWQHPILGQLTEVTENQYVTVGPGSSIQVSRIDSTQTWQIQFNKNGVVDPDDPLINYSVQYKSASDEDWTDLNDVNVLSATEGWSARTLLSVNIGPDISQRLLANQSLTMEFADDTTETITGASPVIRSVTTGNTGETEYTSLNIPYYPVVIESYHNIYYDGGGTHTVTTVLDNDEIEYDSIYSYQEQTTSADKVYRVTNTGDIILTFRPGVNNLTIPYILTPGNYMFRIINASLELETLTVKDVDSNILLSAIYDSTVTNFATISNAILKLVVNSIPAGNAYHTLFITVSDHTSDVTITISNPFKYTKQDYMSEFQFELLEHEISYWDQNHIFNYMYQPNEDDAIINPLLPASFLEVNHIFNHYIICQLDTYNTNIGILNKK